MPPLDPIPPPPPSGRRRALRLGLVVGLVVVVMGGLAFAASSFFFLWNGEHAELPAGEPVKVVRHFFELQDDGVDVVAADLDLALGAVRVAPTEAGALFQAEVDLTSERLRPRFEGTTTGGRARVELSLGGEEVSLRGVRATRGNTWRLYFSERVPLELELSLGAAEADLDLTGIPVSDLALDAGISKATLRFDAPN